MSDTLEAPRTTMSGKPIFSVPAKSVLNLDSGFRHKLLCDGMTFTAGSACAYSCSFCYVEDMMRKNPHWQAIKDKAPEGKFENVVIRREGAVAALRSQLVNRSGPRFMGDDQAGRVVYASPLVDVAANSDLCRETAEMCRAILDLTRWDIRLLSKSNQLPRIAEALHSTHPATSKARVIYGVSTGTLNDGLAKSFEQGTALVSKRLASLYWLQDRGYRTFGMICPSLPMLNYVEWAAEMREAIRADKCEHVWAEVMNVRGESFTRTIAALREGGFHAEAAQLIRVSDPAEWEGYARATFEAHVAADYGPGKLRFLQYVNATNRSWWKARENVGAILL